jgi:N-acetylglutamate synthase
VSSDAYAAAVKGVPLLDELMADAWPPIVEERFGGWRFRWADGVTRRANSVLAVRTDEHIADLVDRAEAFHAQRGAPTLILVSSASAPPGLAAHLRARRYRSTARTLMEVATTTDVAHRARSIDGIETEITGTPTDDWFGAYWSVEAERGRSDADMVVCRDVLLAPRRPAAFASARCGSEVVGVGQLVMGRGWGGIQCMATAAGHRGRGVARSVLHGLAQVAAGRGIGWLYLAAMADNDAATALYGRAGFRVVHEYCYFTDGHPIDDDQPVNG